nr:MULTISPECIES: hypothetical protein [Symbiopectobacterium]
MDKHADRVAAAERIASTVHGAEGNGGRAVSQLLQVGGRKLDAPFPVCRGGARIGFAV